jgi:hypothetical protein
MKLHGLGVLWAQDFSISTTAEKVKVAKINKFVL